MKRDWDLIRKLLTDVEEDNVLFSELPAEPKWENQTEAQYIKELDAFRAIESRIFGHFEMLVDNGYIDGLDIIRPNGSGFYYSLHHPRLTMAGHDLLDTMRSATIWETIKTTAKTKGIELTFDAIKSIGSLVLKNTLG
ncbi:hypothetical protein C3Y98_05220 [Methylotenera oryzisoli]|uniref:DUF2513 domain-containing protein n=1 Tax=Methylotenera oryzisoli TaxID=2080758 RepID=A0A4Y9VSQ7_9PROT|nr:DUF2513 domain-containing protein [Methylotenera oryzisoli]TFW71499.1 hypothetical protein C3Y98_05220 [Methylotenera oryzisoli]